MHHKKIFATAVAMLAFAAFVALPAIASAAQPELVDPAGALAKVKDEVRGESANLVFTTAKGNLECSSNIMEGTVTANPANGKPVEGEITKGAFHGNLNPGGTACKTSIKGLFENLSARITPENFNWCLKTGEKATMTWELRACTAGKRVQFKAELFENNGANLRATCTFATKNESLTGTYNTPNTGAGEKGKLTLGAKQAFTSGSGGLCPAEGTLAGDFELFRKTEGAETMIQ